MELFERNPDTGLDTYWAYDDLTDTFILEYRQDVQSVLEVNKTLANATEYTQQGIKDEMWHYAQVPNSIIMKWLIEDDIDFYSEEDWPRVLAKLNDPDYRFLKTTHKVHGLRS